jgi:hypothetical protein
MHRYSYPITLELQGGAHTTGHYIVDTDVTLSDEEQEQSRLKYEKLLNEQTANPLLPGAQYTLGLPRYRKMRK